MRSMVAITVLLASICPDVAASPQQSDPPRKVPQRPEPPQKEPAKGKKQLGVGDRVPGLHATHWLQGSEVTEFKPGEVSVVVFWAPWCAPCVVMLPYLGRLQNEFQKQDVRVIAFSARDANNSLDKVTAFLEKRKSKLAISIAYEDGPGTFRDWMAGEKSRTIPYAFIVGKDGTVIFAGHPMLIGEVLPKVVAGKWTASDAEALAKLSSEVEAVLAKINGLDSALGLKALEEFEKSHARLAGMPHFIEPRIRLLIQNKKNAEALKAASTGIEASSKSEDAPTLEKISWLLRKPPAINDKEMLQLSVKAARAAVQIAGEGDMLALLNLAESYYAIGDLAHAHEFGTKAIAATTGESPAMKKYVKEQVEKFDQKNEKQH